MSDEGLMTADIEDCLEVVTKALKKSDLPPAEIVTWCDKMAAADSVGFIFDQELRALRNHFEGRGRNALSDPKAAPNERIAAEARSERC